MSSLRSSSGIAAPASSSMSDTSMPDAPLRRALLLDAVASGTMGVGLIVLAETMTTFLGLPVTLLRWAGVLLVPYALVVAWVGTRRPVKRGAAIEIVIVNIAWIAASLALLALPVIQPTTLGSIFVVGQAAAVGLFALLQTAGIRRARA